MAEEPTCVVSNGSSISPSCWSSLRSVAALCEDWATPESACDDEIVLLARVRLTRNALAPLEPGAAGERGVELLDLRGIALEEREKGRLRSGGALRAEKAEALAGRADLLEVDQEVRGPERGALADGRGLGRLKVRVGEGGKVPVSEGEIPQLPEQGHEPALRQGEPLAHLEQVGVVGDVGRGRAPVDDPARRGRRRSEDAHVRHDVVAGPGLLGGRRVEVDVREVGAHLRQRLLGNREPQPALLLGEPQPEPAPGLELVLGGEDRGHLCRGVTLGQRMHEGVSLHPVRLLRRG